MLVKVKYQLSQLSQCFVTNLPMFLLCLLSHLIDCIDSNACGTLDRQETLSVMAVLNFHACIRRHVYYLVNGWFVSFHSLLNEHVQIKRLIGLLLAVLNTKFLPFTLCNESFTVDAVHVTLTEQEIRQALLHISLTFV